MKTYDQVVNGNLRLKNINHDYVRVPLAASTSDLLISRRDCVMIIMVLAVWEHGWGGVCVLFRANRVPTDIACVP